MLHHGAVQANTERGDTLGVIDVQPLHPGVPVASWSNLKPTIALATHAYIPLGRCTKLIGQARATPMLLDGTHGELTCSGFKPLVS